jgi:CubicO group peptidase (beta-lactamase class C family)
MAAMFRLAWLLAAALGACSANAPVPAPAPSPARQAAPVAAPRPSPLVGLDAYVERAMHDWNVPGVAIAVVQDDAVLLARGYGVAEIGKPDRVDDDTLFQIGSCGKAFTSIALAMLVEKRELAWDDPIAKYVPAADLPNAAAARQITARDLLLNRSGMPGLEAGEAAIWFGKPISRQEVLHHVADVQGWPLRKHFDYSNVGYLAAGELVPAIAHTSWDDFVTEQILQPLGMARTSTSTRVLERDRNAAHAHNASGGSLHAVPWYDLDNVGPAGSIVSSARDMAQWLRFQLANGKIGERRVIDDALVAATRAPGIDVPPGPVWTSGFPAAAAVKWAMGWAVYPYRGHQVIEHIGLVPGGMHAAVGLMPSERLGVVVLTNVDFQSNRLPEALRYKIYDLVLAGAGRDWSSELHGR